MSNGALNEITPSGNQAYGALDRALLTLGSSSITWALTQHYIGDATALFLTTGVIPMLAIVYGLFANRDMAVVRKAANVEGTTVMTKPELAESTPETNIVSNVKGDQ